MAAPESMMAGLFAQQWRLARMQVVNWGTFCGYHDFALATNRTDGTAPVIMITGESGTGKSTLLDAKTAVLQRNNVRFNSASNAVAHGRARGGSQRSIYSYVLGKQDDVLDPDTGEEHESFLRTTATPQWSAVVLGFADTSGAGFSAARFWYLPQGGDEADLKTFMLTAPQDLDPRLLGPALTQAPGKRTFAEVYPAATQHDTVSAFLTYVYGELGIGDAGDGDNAMKLHERIQGGYPITDVDALFKELVIDEPTTYDYAQKALAAFDEGEGVWRQMDEIRRKVEALSGIREIYTTYTQQSERAGLLESLLMEGPVAGTAPGHGVGAAVTPSAVADPLGLVLARRHLEVLAHATDEAHATEAEQQDELARTEVHLATQQRELEEVRREVAEQGGDALDRRRQELEAARAQAKARASARKELADLLAIVRQDLPADEPAYTAMAREAGVLLSGRDAANEQLNARLVALGVEAQKVRAQLEETSRQLDFYRRNRTRITPQMGEARAAMTKALGVPATDLPYAAELMDMAPGQEDWRLAACIGYHGLATRVLVDARRLDDLSRAIDSLKLGRRVTFTGVDLARSRHGGQGRRGWLSSKMQVKPGTPFAGWLWDQMSRPENDWRCVDGPDQLGGRERRIDPAGQTREGMRGAHGYDPRTTLIIGFANDDLIAQLQAQKDDLTRQLMDLNGQTQDVSDAQKLLDRRCDAARWMAHHAWDDVDVEAARAQVRELEEEVRRLEGDDALRRLVERRDALDRAVMELQQGIGAGRHALGQTQTLLSALEARAETARTSLDAAGHTGLVATPRQEAVVRAFLQDQEQGLSPLAGGASWRDLADAFPRVCERVRTEVRSSLGVARKQTSQAQNMLEKIFSTYHTQWLGEDDPTGVGVASYPDYLRMLEELEANKLNEPRNEWLRTMYSQVGASLVPLSDAFSQDLRQIRGRMRPINQIMGQFDFGPEHGQLEILVRDRTAAATARLRRELNEFSELATKPEQAMAGERYHQRLRDFMERLREELARGDRGALNTKGLVRITVLARYPKESGKPDNTFSSLDAKSGGETQELIAFILGAALLFCLGRNAEGLPSFSPVFLDEAFIKADEHFTRRAINALRGLGFQIVIAVPTSKVQAVEPVADQYVCITKSREGHSFVSPLARG